MEKILSTLQETFVTKLGGTVGEWAPKLIMALITLIIGLWIIKMIMRGIGKMMDKSQIDETLKPFLLTLAGFLLKVMLFIAVASQIGIETTSFIAVLGALSLAVGMALQGALGNFAAGVLLLIFRPFKKGDLIEVQGELGFVTEISILATTMETFQNKTAIVPNGPLFGGNIINYSRKGNVRADIPFAIRYGSDIEKAKEIVLNVLKNSKYVLQDPAPSVYVTELTNTNIQLTALPFTTVADYWDVYWGLRGEIATALGNAGYDAPYEQRVIHMKNA